MSRIIKLLNNETIEIVEYSKANACFQTNKYPNDELFCVIREQINPFDMFQEKLSLEQEIERLNNMINELNEYKNAIYEIKKYIDSYSPYFIETQEENNEKIALIINNIGK